ncbi:GyrI-like domain-containing protein [Lachnospiraceae bacterium LCP25S3_G4]
MSAQGVVMSSYGMELTEVVGIEVSSDDKLPHDLIAKTIPASKYAVFTHKGAISDILKTY